MKKILTILAVLILGTIIITGCGNAANSSSVPATGNDVHMKELDFVEKTITINKGESITLINDTSAPHIIANGRWVNNSQQPKQESGAPIINNLQIAGLGSKANIGPFNTTGTFYLYCPIHVAMNLTVVVE